MKLKTIALIGCMAAFFTAFAVFVDSDHNQALLLHRFEFFNYSFSVIETLAAVMIGSAGAAGMYFSLRMLDQLRDERQFGRFPIEDRSGLEVQKAADLIRHGMPGRGLEALAEKVDTQAAYRRGLALHQLGRTPEAIIALKHAAYERAEAGYLLAEILVQDQQSPEDVLRHLITTHPQDAKNAYLKLFDLLEKQKRWDACLELCTQMERNGLPVPLGRMVAYRYEHALNQTNQLELLQQLLKDAPDFVPANLALGEAYMKTGAVEKAFRVYEQAFDKTGNTVFLDRLEDYYLEQGSPEDVVEIYQLLLSQKDNVTIQLKLGKLYFRLDMFNESREVLEPLLKHFSRIPSFLWMLAEIEARSERAMPSLEYLRDLVALVFDPNRDYQCKSCHQYHANWAARCHRCGNWGTIRQQEDE